MSRDEIKVTDAELQVLQLLWDEAPLGAVDLAERLPAELDWTLATVKTLLSRLLRKGAVSAEECGRRYLYAPAIDRDTVATSQAGRLVDRLFGGRVSPLVAPLAEQRDLDPRDIAELEALVRSLKK